MISSLIILCTATRYPYNNFLHHHVESIILSCLESKHSLVEHLFLDCDLIRKILQAEKIFTLVADSDKVVAYAFLSDNMIWRQNYVARSICLCARVFLIL